MCLSRFICQFTAMIVNHFLGNTQAESAMGSVCSVFIGPIESVEKSPRQPHLHGEIASP